MQEAIIQDLNLGVLKEKARQLRLDILEMTTLAGSGHPSSSFSAVEILTALYFGGILRYRPTDPWWPERDRFIMSKGHSVPAQYAALAMLKVFPLEELATLKQLGSRLQGHPVMHCTPGVEGCTGSLGQGLSFANGVALAARLQNYDYQVFCLIGDGELHEGQVWEAAMTTPRHCLTNVTVIIDRNGLKAMDESNCGKLLEPLAPRWASFGWQVREIDGHNLAQICAALDWATATTDSPCAIIAHTVKGKGVSFMEAAPLKWHGVTPTPDQAKQSIEEIEKA